MILSFDNSEDGGRVEVEAKMVAEDGRDPMIVLQDESILDPVEWAALEYRVIRASKKETEQLRSWLVYHGIRQAESTKEKK